MRVAIVHDHLLYLGGAERVILALLDLFPYADVYLGFLSDEGRTLLRRKTKGIVVSSLFNRFPFAQQMPDWYKPALLWYWERLNVSRYDLVISSSHSFSSKSIIVPAGTVHVSYIHTPPRYLYDEYNETRWTRHPAVQAFLRPVFSWMRRKDHAAAQRPNVLIANSKTVQQRITRYYGRDSVVIYPPIHTPPKVILRGRKPTYFLCVSRLVKQKGIDLAIRACGELKLPVVIVGTGPQEAYLRSIAGPTVIFLGFVSDDKMAEVYRKARVLLYCSRDEDFGMAPVEAMAHGVPVIGYSSGGVQETVVDGKTGILFSDYSITGLEGAIHKLLRHSWSPRLLRSQAEKSSEKEFMKQMKTIIKNQYE
ncbi:glycosyltransferase [Candidatus Gottesmanbacteria bacterium]|nr:glycosyltransferase [Candidatus Gottesmanbacteria bacterium]